MAAPATGAASSAVKDDDLSRIKMPPPEYERYFPRTFQDNPRGQMFPVMSWEVVTRVRTHLHQEALDTIDRIEEFYHRQCPGSPTGGPTIRQLGVDPADPRKLPAPSHMEWLLHRNETKLDVQEWTMDRCGAPAKYHVRYFVENATGDVYHSVVTPEPLDFTGARAKLRSNTKW